MTYSFFLPFVSTLLFVIAIENTVRQALALRMFSRQMSAIDSLEGETQFKLGGALGRAANQMLSQMRAVLERKYATTADFRAELGAVQRHLYGAAALPRSLAGVLILSGLLITLSALKDSVAQLQQAFQRLASSSNGASGAVVDGRAIQTGMAQVAAAAAHAFSASFIVISGAAIVICACAYLNRRALAVAALLDLWSAGLVRDALTKKPAVERGDEVQAMREAAGKMVEVAAALDKVTSKLNPLETFSSALEEAVGSLIGAVDKLPAAVNASVATISDEVATGIRDSLNQQLGHIKNVQAIYADQEIRMKAVVDLCKEQTRLAVTAQSVLEALSTVPDSLSGIKRAVDKAIQSTESLNESSAALQAKVESLPSAEIKNAAFEVRKAALSVESSNDKLNQAVSDFRISVASNNSSDRDSSPDIRKAVSEVKVLASAVDQSNLRLSAILNKLESVPPDTGRDEAAFASAFGGNGMAVVVRRADQATEEVKSELAQLKTVKEPKVQVQERPVEEVHQELKVPVFDDDVHDVPVEQIDNVSNDQIHESSKHQEHDRPADQAGPAHKEPGHDERWWVHFGRIFGRGR